MTLGDWLPWAAAAVSVVAAVGAIVQNRRKPALDDAQATSALVNSDSVKQTIREMADRQNARRDLRNLMLEAWADEIRPVISIYRQIIADLCARLKTEIEARGGHMDAVVVPPVPPFPPPDVPPFPVQQPIG